MPTPFPFSSAEKIALFHAAHSRADVDLTQLKAAVLSAERSGGPIGELFKTLDLIAIHQDKKANQPLLSIDPIWTSVPGHPGVSYLSFLAPMGGMRDVPSRTKLAEWSDNDMLDHFCARRLRPLPTVAIENETWTYTKPDKSLSGHGTITRGHLRGTLFASNTAGEMDVFLASRPSLQLSMNLANAMATGEHERMRQAISEGADLLRMYGGRKTALHVAAGYNRPEQVELLLAAGADPSIRDVNGRTPEQCPKIDPATAQVFQAWRARQAMDSIVQRAKSSQGQTP